MQLVRVVRKNQLLCGATALWREPSSWLSPAARKMTGLQSLLKQACACDQALPLGLSYYPDLAFSQETATNANTLR